MARLVRPAVPLDEAIYPGSESGREFYDRCASFIDGLEGDEGTPVIVSHGGALICLVGRWLGFSVEALEPVGFEFHTTSITVLRHFRDDVPHGPIGRAIERLNDTSHLSSAEGRVGLGRILP
jgi:broad specificity phosphatase PhoE